MFGLCKLALSLVVSGSLLFVGDSRFVGMSDAVECCESEQFYCKVGKGYAWFEKNKDEIEKNITDDTVIVFGLGVNDLYNIKKYETLSELWYFDKMYFLSVNPVEEEKESKWGYFVSNKDIEKFNVKMKELFGDRYIDCNSYLTVSGFKTLDGLHYSKDTYKKIYSYVKLMLTIENL